MTSNPHTAAGAVTDLHTHILPGVDDGSASVEESLELLRLEAEQGIRHVVATPHFYPHHDAPDRFLRRREAAVSLLQEAMQGSADLPAVSIGAEVYFYFGMSESEVLRELSLTGQRAVLVEMPRSPWPDAMYTELEGIWDKQGLLPVIAHVDRYIRPFRTYGIPDRLAELPVMVQANADFFLNWTTSSMALRLLREEKIHLLGSDCHNLRSRRPNLAAAIQRITGALGPEALEQIRRNQQQILPEPISVI